MLMSLMKKLQVEDLTKSMKIKMWVLNIKLNSVVNHENLRSHKDFEQGISLTLKVI